ncbi:MAG: hypothetical protein D6715_09295 [Calditrichaeota bacterium]|nr:MAG: hypothetical protein D6715_09295 [Calditrichota bacterium]
MSLGQSLFTFLVFTLLVVFIRNSNRVYSNLDLQFAQNRYRLEALSILNSYAEEATQYVFDEAVVDTNVSKKLSEFTDPDQLGFEANDNGKIDDFDDYNNYTVSDTGQSGIVYKLQFQVDYVKLSGGEFVQSNTKEYHKRLRIELFDQYDPPVLFHWANGQKVKDTLRVTFVYSYWFYN